MNLYKDNSHRSFIKIIMSVDNQHISVSVVGHVDSGKSPTTGRLIYELGGILFLVLQKNFLLSAIIILLWIALDIGILFVI